MLLCNPIFDVDGDGLVVGTSEQGFSSGLFTFAFVSTSMVALNFNIV